MPWPGAPLEPTGDPMRDAVGPASYAQRADVPDLTVEGHDKIVPMRIATDFSIANGRSRSARASGYRRRSPDAPER